MNGCTNSKVTSKKVAEQIQRLHQKITGEIQSLLQINCRTNKKFISQKGRANRKVIAD